MIHLCSSKIVEGIFCIGFVESLVVEVRCHGFHLWGMAFYSIWGVYGL